MRWRHVLKTGRFVDLQKKDASKILKSMAPPDPKKMISFFLENMRSTIKRVVAFANLLPGCINSLIIIGVTYEGHWNPHFLDWGTPYPIFQDENVKNFEEFAVNRGDLWRLNYNKNRPGSARELVRFPRPQNRMGRGQPPPHFPPLSSRDQRAPRSPSF